MKDLITINQNGQPVASSRDIAEHFEKEHRNVLRDIDDLRKDVLNFEQMFFSVEIPDSYGRPQRAYLMNRDGFSLLVMGFTGKSALEWKLKYIDAFNRMEAQIKNPQLSPAEQLLAQAQLMVEQERRLKALENRAERTEQTMQKTLDIFSAPAVSPDDWTSAMNHQINTLVEQYGGNHRKFRSDRYAELESETGVDLKCRQTRLRNRMRKNGATETECKQVSILQVISRDRKLRPAFEAIIRRKAASLISDAQM
jgi:Rha family phage regulatory protein